MIWLCWSLLKAQKLEISRINIGSTLCKQMFEKGLCSCKNGIISRSDGNIKNEYFHFWVIQTSPFSKRSWKRNIWGLLSQKFTEWASAPRTDFHRHNSAVLYSSSSDGVSVLLSRNGNKHSLDLCFIRTFYIQTTEFPYFFLPGISEHSPTPGHLTGHCAPFLMAACGSWETQQPHQFFGLKL